MNARLKIGTGGLGLSVCAVVALLAVAGALAQDAARGPAATQPVPGNAGRGGRGGGGRGGGANGPVAGPFGTPGIDLKPFVIDHRHASDSLVDMSFLLEAPAGKRGYIRAENSHLVTGDGQPIRFWGFCLTEWSPGSIEIPSKEDAPIYAAALARYGVNFVRLHFLDLDAPRGMIDGSQGNTQHFDKDQLDREDFFISEMLKRGIYIDFNLFVGRQFKNGDDLLTSTPPTTAPAAAAGGRGRGRGGPTLGKSELFFDKRGIELEKDYAKQFLTHVNPYTGRKYVDEPGMAIVELVNEAAVDIGSDMNGPYGQELDGLYNAWLTKNRMPDQIKHLKELANVASDQPMPRLSGQTARNAPREQYYTECDFFHDLESGFFKDMSDYLKHDLGVKCLVMGTADHSHSGSGLPVVWADSAIDIVDGHDYWQHPSVNPGNSPMVNDPFNSYIAEMSRSPVAGKPFTVSEIGNPFPNQYAAEGIPILAAYGDFQGWDAMVFYTFEMKKDPNWQPTVGDAFDTSLDPVKMPQIAAGAMMFIRGDVDQAKQTITRTYTRQQVWDSRQLAGAERPWFTPGYPLSASLLHGVRIGSFDGKATEIPDLPKTGPFKSDTGQLVWDAGTDEKTGLVTIDSPKSQALVGFVKARQASVTNLSSDVKNDFCSIMLGSMDGKPISASSKMLLTAGVRVENTGMTWNPRRIALNNRGTSPTLIEPVTGKIILKNLDGASGVSAIALDGSGHAIGQPIAAAKTAAGWEIPVGDPVTTWYLVNVAR